MCDRRGRCFATEHARFHTQLMYCSDRIARMHSQHSAYCLHGTEHTVLFCSQHHVSVFDCRFTLPYFLFFGGGDAGSLRFSARSCTTRLRIAVRRSSTMSATASSLKYRTTCSLARSPTASACVVCRAT
jgi:hypothetical protein